MQRLTALTLCPVVIAIAACGGGNQIGLAYVRDLYVSQIFQLQLVVPKGWHVATEPSGVPVLFSYPSSKGLPQGLIPDGGAEIYLIPYSAVETVSPAASLNEWITVNNARWHRRVKTVPVASWTRDRDSPQEITKVEADYERTPDDGELQSEVSYYFVLRDSGYRLQMLHNKDEPRAAYFDSVVKSVLRSIRMLPRR